MQEAVGAEVSLGQLEAQLLDLLAALTQQAFILLPSKPDELLDGSGITFICVVVQQLLPCLRLVLHTATSVSPEGSLQAAQVSLARATSTFADAIRQFLKLSDKEQTEHASRAADVGMLLAQHPECKTLLTKLCTSQRKTVERLLPSLK